MSAIQKILRAVKQALRFILIVLLILCLCVASAALGCWRQIRVVQQPTELRPAQAAIVLGAAVWPGPRPSSTLAARTRKAVQLFDDGYVQWIATTGGVASDYPSEGSVAAAYAKELGIPGEYLIIEGTSTSTWTNLQNLLPQLHELGISEVIIVSDGFHLARAQRMALDLGLETVQVAASVSAFSPPGVFAHEMREVAALLSYLYLGS